MKRAVLFLLLLASVPAGGLRAQLAGDSVQRRSTIKPGDAIRITVWQRPDYSGEFPIDADGRIVHPIMRGVTVSGIPIRAVEDRIAQFLTGHINQPQVVVEPLVRVSVGGEVKTPNLYTVSPEVTIVQALALAGGANEEGDLRRVQVIRRNQRLRLDLTAPESPAHDMPVNSGDQIVVGRRRQFVRDVLAPASSITGAVWSILNFIAFLSRD